MLRDIPYLLLGRVVGAEEITLHILFPHLACPEGQFKSITKEQLTHWLDEIFYPAVYRLF